MKRPKGEAEDVRREAEVMLKSIAHTTGVIAGQVAEYTAAQEALAAKYEQAIATLNTYLAADEKALYSLMKINRRLLFDGTDVVNLPPGSLIRTEADKVKIPKTALADCEAQGFSEVIKIVKSLDRDAIEKWPDARLALIGAERLTKEEFNYDLKK
jgi:hypothetical protein